MSALRAFEAAARYQNFSHAAQELHLTSSAISHQVRTLEDELGVPLFVRHGKRLAVTADGQRFALTLRRLLMEIAEATEAMKQNCHQKRLVVTTTPSFAARWLTPRLGKFIEQSSDVEVLLQSTPHLTDFSRESVDIGIRVGEGYYPGLHVEKLMDDYYYPVVSPHFHGGCLPDSPAAMLNSVLLRSELEPWQPWLRAAGLNIVEPACKLLFQDSSMLIRAAVEGHGIALARHSLVAAELTNGTLVRLFDLAIP